jgi:methylmalonyl-CoA mutase C-terminal domain/subunit
VRDRKVRALITVLGLDQHEAGALAVSRMLRDAGMEVIYTGRFSIPETVAAVAEQEDADVVGVSAHSWEFGMLGRASPPIPVVVGGSIITDEDRRQALDAGISEVVRRGATEDEIVETFRRLADPDFRAGLAPAVSP